MTGYGGFFTQPKIMVGGNSSLYNTNKNYAKHTPLECITNNQDSYGQKMTSIMLTGAPSCKMTAGRQSRPYLSIVGILVTLNADTGIGFGDTEGHHIIFQTIIKHEKCIQRLVPLN